MNQTSLLSYDLYSDHPLSLSLLTFGVACWMQNRRSPLCFKNDIVLRVYLRHRTQPKGQRSSELKRGRRLSDFIWFRRPAGTRPQRWHTCMFAMTASSRVLSIPRSPLVACSLLMVRLRMLSPILSYKSRSRIKSLSDLHRLRISASLCRRIGSGRLDLRATCVLSDHYYFLI